MLASLLFVILTGIGSLVLPLLVTVAFLVGFFGMGTLYEYTHYRYHSKNPVAKIFIVLRKHHFYHHFHNPKVNHGVTSRIWDRVFGTFIPVEKVNIPHHMLMDWLVDNNELKPIYTNHFRILGKHRTS